MSEKEYIVSLHRGVNAEEFNNDMIGSTGKGSIPARTVSIANARPGSYRSTHYALTDEEAIELSKDPRVAGVEIPPEQRSDIRITHNSIQSEDFSKTTSDSAKVVNWGLRRINEEINPYVGSVAPGGYNYTLDGTGVDVVVLDSGIQFGHPEVYDDENNERLQRINWFVESGVPGTQPGGLYSDYSGHGTHVIGIVAGKTFGWAKNARIYSMKIQGLEGPADPLGGVPVNLCFDVVKNWHRRKPIDPATGYKRPTVVNISWSYTGFFDNITGGSYRGVPWTGTARDTAKGMVGELNPDTGEYEHPVRLVSVDTDLEEMIDEGIHVCIAAGNTRQKIDVPGGIDYNNYFTSSFYAGNRYYHRGGSPFNDKAIIVGNADSQLHAGGLEQKEEKSETGPAVDVYAPGTDIMSGSSQVSIYATAPYQFGNNFYKQMNITGSSMAAPQVAGVLALYLQLNPNATPAQGKAWVNAFAQDNQLYDDGIDNNYTDPRSLLGGNNKYMFNKFNSSIRTTISFPSP